MIQMDEFIFTQNNVDEVQVNSQNEYYCINGSEEFLDDNRNPRVSKESDNRVLAKKIFRDDGSFRMSIKLTNNGKVQNPMSIYGAEKQSSFLDRVCRSQNRFKEVNMKVFNSYVNFLRTKNVAFLHNAEREMQ
jgi:hypothetical protein